MPQPVEFTMFYTPSTRGPGPGWYFRLKAGGDDLLPVTKMSQDDVEIFTEHGERAMRGSTGPITEAVKKMGHEVAQEREARRRELREAIHQAQLELNRMDSNDRTGA
jgi:hypothetical protein